MYTIIVQEDASDVTNMAAAPEVSTNIVEFLVNSNNLNAFTLQRAVFQ